MTASFKDGGGTTIGIGWDTLTEGSYQVMGDANATATNGLVIVRGALTAGRRLALTYPPNAASQASYEGMTVIVCNTGTAAQNVEVEQQAGGGVQNVAQGETGIFYLTGASLQYTLLELF